MSCLIRAVRKTNFNALQTLLVVVVDTFSQKKGKLILFMWFSPRVGRSPSDCCSSHRPKLARVTPTVNTDCSLAVRSAWAVEETAGKQQQEAGGQQRSLPHTRRSWWH